MMRAFARVCRMIALLALLASPAWADAKSDAQQLLTEGNRLATEGDFVGALAKFREAHDRYPSTKILLNIGTTLFHLGRNVEAAQTYEQYLESRDADPARADEVRYLLGEIEKNIARIQVRVSERGAEVRLDGHSLTRPALDASGAIALRVEPGEHTLTATKAGFLTASRTLELAAGDHLSFVLELRRPEAARRERPAPGPAPGNETQRIFGYGLLGTAAGAAIVGGVFGVLAKLKNDDAAEHCRTETVCDETGVRLGDTAQQNAAVSTISFVIAGVALGSGALLLYTDPSRNAARGITLEGRW